MSDFKMTDPSASLQCFLPGDACSPLPAAPAADIHIHIPRIPPAASPALASPPAPFSTLPLPCLSHPGLSSLAPRGSEAELTADPAASGEGVFCCCEKYLGVQVGRQLDV